MSSGEIRRGSRSLRGWGGANRVIGGGTASGTMATARRYGGTEDWWESEAAENGRPGEGWRLGGSYVNVSNSYAICGYHRETNAFENSMQ